MSKFKVSLEYKQPVRAIERVKFLASLCYQPTIEKARQEAHKIPVKSGLFKPGHHTPMESTHWPFILDNIPVSLITFGLHATHPFYNSLQRSGRYCYDMFTNDDYKSFVRDFIGEYCPETLSDVSILDWVIDGVEFFNKVLPRVTAQARTAILDERPNFSGDLDKHATRIAQEQLRGVISTIFPSGLSHDIDTITLASMFHGASSRPLKDLMGRMVSAAIYDGGDDEGDLGFLAKDYYDTDMSWAPTLRHDKVRLIYEPRIIVNNTEGLEASKRHAFDNFDKLHSPLDLLPFTPLGNYQNTPDVSILTVMSTVTYGQDQRHRTIDRGNPWITGEFMVPPLLKGDAEIEDFCSSQMQRWLDMCTKFSTKTAIHFIPYGACIGQAETTNDKALYHYMSRRSCIRAMGEVAQVAKSIDDQIFPSGNSPFGAPCKSGKCPEGKNYCGRDMTKPIKRILI